MKSLVTLSIGLVLFLGIGHAQSSTSLYDRPHIEVTGQSERLVVPDEIYVSITLKEKETGKNKFSISEQENHLKKALQEINVPLDRLSVSNAQADYIQVKWSKSEVITQSQYELKLSTAEQVALVFNKLDSLDAYNSYISKVSHSRIKELEKEVEVEAIVNAKNKATYLLEAIGQQTGTALVINRSKSIRPLQGVMIESKATQSNYPVASQSKVKTAIGFKKIKLESIMQVVFEIK
jgi:uncharacterized protein YggE